MVLLLRLIYSKSVCEYTSVEIESIKYIIEFLVGKELSRFISYGRCVGDSIVIVPSGWFKRPAMPLMPVKQFEGFPVLFGEPKIEEHDGRLFVYADIVASSYFLMSRYEELLNPVRDIHGRFPGKASSPYKNGFLDRPVVDEYGRWMRSLIAKRFGVSVPPEVKRISKLWLTHDVDTPFETRGLSGRLRDVLGNLVKRRCFSLRPIIEYLTGKSIPYTFPWLLEFDSRLAGENVESVYFVLARKDGDARDNWYIEDPRWPSLLSEFCKYRVTLGLHISYIAGDNMASVTQEIGVLQSTCSTHITKTRHHFLRMTDPSDFRYLETAGITDDFSVGYADVAGFRVGTCRPYRWIDPRRGEVGKLVIHPMTIMECSLDNPSYMGLGECAAWEYSQKMISTVAEYEGECVLLWHNTSLMPTNGNWQRELYCKCSHFAKSKL